MEKDRIEKGVLLLVFVAVAALPWPAKATKADELSDLKEQLSNQAQELQETKGRLEQLEARQRLKEKSLEGELEELKKLQPQADPADLRVFWKEGLNLATLDGDFKLKIGGRLMTDWFFSSEDQDVKLDVGEQEDNAEFRRARIYSA
jgi:hypothetical protein